MDIPTSAPLTCRWHLHHHWGWFRTDDGEPYERCSRCGKDHDERGGGGPVDLRSPGPFGI
jgi:hypothetical protein